MKLQIYLFPVIVLMAFFSLFFIVLPILAYTNQVSLETFLQIISMLLSWPVVTALLAFTFFARYHDVITAYLTNVGILKLPGGIELQKQPAPSHIEKLDKNLSKVKAEEVRTEKNIESNTGTSTHTTSDQVRYWKFLYLNLFFVPQTKNMLSWLAKNPNQTRLSINNLWAAFVVDNGQRNLILDVLMVNGMVHEVGGNIRVTQEGNEFLKYIGLA